jgi:hypothetical protein
MIPLRRIIVGIDRNSSAQMLFPRCGMQPVTFLPQDLRLWTDFRALAPPLSNRRHAGAIPVTQTGAA